MQVKLTLGVSRLPLNLDAPLEVECAGCGNPLDVHQPDLDRPERLLGTCDACGAWFLILPHNDRDTALMLRLPDEREIGRQSETTTNRPLPHGLQ